MKAAVYYRNDDIRIEDRPVPRIGGGEILVKIVASGICGSDVMEWYRIKKAPRVLGHEVAGEVVEVGAGVKRYKSGDRVFVTHHVPCGECRYCKDGNETVCDTLRATSFDPGGFAELVRVPKINVEKGVRVLPEEVSYEEGTFVEPLGCVVRGQRLVGGLKGKSVLVMGSGISGLLHIQVAKASGAGKVFATDISGFRLKSAERFGADLVIDAMQDVPEKVRKANGGRLADVVIVCTGALPAVKQALDSVEKGGTILFFAPTEPGIRVPVDLNTVWSKCVTITTSYAAAGKDLDDAIGLIRDKKVDVKGMVTHRLPLAEAQKGFRLVAEAKDSIKVILEPEK